MYHLHAVDPTEIYAFVIMPNHLHAIIRCPEDDPVSDVARDLESNMARLIVRQFQAEGNDRVLDFLAAAVTRPKRQKYKVWEDGYSAKNVFSVDFLRQKMPYIHSNPLQPHWQLADSPEAYVWSSARFCLLGEPALIPLSDAGELF